MKKFKKVYDYAFGEFVDYKGLKHHVTLCALSRNLPLPEEETPLWDKYKADSTSINADYLLPIYGIMSHHPVYGNSDLAVTIKSLSIGYAVCNPEDKYNEEYGKAKAKSRADKITPIIWSTQRGCINTRMVRVLLQQEMDYIINNPDQIIKGYSEAKDRFEKKAKAHLEYSQLEGCERVVSRFMKDNPKRARELALLVKSL